MKRVEIYKIITEVVRTTRNSKILDSYKLFNYFLFNTSVSVILVQRTVIKINHIENTIFISYKSTTSVY